MTNLIKPTPSEVKHNRKQSIAEYNKTMAVNEQIRMRDATIKQFIEHDPKTINNSDLLYYSNIFFTELLANGWLKLPLQATELLVEHLNRRVQQNTITKSEVLAAALLIQLINDQDLKQRLIDVLIMQSGFNVFDLLFNQKDTNKLYTTKYQVLAEFIAEVQQNHKPHAQARAPELAMGPLELILNSNSTNPAITNTRTATLELKASVKASEQQAIAKAQKKTAIATGLLIARLNSDFEEFLHKVNMSVSLEDPTKLLIFLMQYPFADKLPTPVRLFQLRLMINLAAQSKDVDIMKIFLNYAIEFLKTDAILADKIVLLKDIRENLPTKLNIYFANTLDRQVKANRAYFSKDTIAALYDHKFVMHDFAHLNSQILAIYKFLYPDNKAGTIKFVTADTMNMLWANKSPITLSKEMRDLMLNDFTQQTPSLAVRRLAIELSGISAKNQYQRNIKTDHAPIQCMTSTKQRRDDDFTTAVKSMFDQVYYRWNSGIPLTFKIDAFIPSILDASLCEAGSIYLSICYVNGKYEVYMPHAPQGAIEFDYADQNLLKNYILQLFAKNYTVTPITADSIKCAQIARYSGYMNIDVLNHRNRVPSPTHTPTREQSREAVGSPVRARSWNNLHVKDSGTPTTPNPFLRSLYLMHQNKLIPDGMDTPEMRPITFAPDKPRKKPLF